MIWGIDINNLKASTQHKLQHRALNILNTIPDTGKMNFSLIILKRLKFSVKPDAVKARLEQLPVIVDYRIFRAPQFLIEKNLPLCFPAWG